jgi:hypothetical protein
VSAIAKRLPVQEYAKLDHEHERNMVEEEFSIEMDE